MTRIRNDIHTSLQASIRARVRTGIPAFALVTAAIAAGAATMVACGGDEPLAPPFDPSDAATDVLEASLPPVDDAGVQDDADAARPTYDASDEPVVCASTPCVTQIAAGERHFCALLSDGTVRCWGTDTSGSLGRGELGGGTDAGIGPQAVAGITNATQISAGAQSNTTCVRDAEGDVWCWGDNSDAQLGLGDRDSDAHPTPTQVALVSQVARVDVGQANACAITDSGKVYCWGANDSRQLARPDSNSFYEGVGLAELGDHQISRIILAQYSSFAVTKDGQLLGWGRASGRQSSLSSNEGSAIPVPLPSLSGVTRAATSGFVSGSGGHQCAVAGGSVYCWGDNTRGELGTGVPDDGAAPGVRRDHHRRRCLPAAACARAEPVVRADDQWNAPVLRR